ncbi:MAG: hypothetical protein ACTHQ3_21550 [Motilibacteraceae bacterium]
MDRRRTGVLLATSGTLAGALLARRARLGNQSGNQSGNQPEEQTGGGPTPLTAGGGAGRRARPQHRSGGLAGAWRRRPRSFGWRSHTPVPGASSRSVVPVRAGAPAGIFAPANAHPES